MVQTIHSTSLNTDREEEVRKSFRMISYLLQYPDKRWLQWGELVEELEEFLDKDLQAFLAYFLEKIGDYSFDDLEQYYVDLFDFNPECSLSLSYLKAGEQRERGQILVELKALYKQYGYEMTDDELSDYLPVVLEFASVAPLQIAVNLLNSLEEPIEKLRGELKQQNSPYEYLLQAALCGKEALEDINSMGGRG